MSTQPLPLEGIRIVDFTAYWAGPLPTAIMADLGAEVIKVESIQRPDQFRIVAIPGDPAEVYELSPPFNATNRNKLELTLDLARPDGVRLFKELVKRSDAVVQNYSPRVMPQLGLSYEILREVNPAIVMTSVSGFGQEGPWRDYVSFAAIGEALSGISGLSGYTGEGALIHGVGVSDPFAGYLAAFCTLAAVHHARATGEGQHVDVSQLEASMQYIADALIEFEFTGRPRERATSDDSAMAPHGAFPARGEDAWVAIERRDRTAVARAARGDGRSRMVLRRALRHATLPPHNREALQRHSSPSGPRASIAMNSRAICNRAASPLRRCSRPRTCSRIPRSRRPSFFSTSTIPSPDAIRIPLYRRESTASIRRSEGSARCSARTIITCCRKSSD